MRRADVIVPHSMTACTFSREGALVAAVPLEMLMIRCCSSRSVLKVLFL